MFSQDELALQQEHFAAWERGIRACFARLEGAGGGTFWDWSFEEVAYRLEAKSVTAAHRRGDWKFVVLAGAHNLGKTTTRKFLAEKHGFANFAHFTTRRPRAYEVDGMDQYFVDEDQLFALAKAGVVERMSRQGSTKHYFTAVDTSTLHRYIEHEHRFVMERQLVTWEAMQSQLPAHLQERAHRGGLMVFLLPPSLREYRARIAGRVGQTEPDPARRPAVLRAECERSFSKHYLVAQAALTDNVVFIVADDLERTARVIAQLIPEPSPVAAAA